MSGGAEALKSLYHRCTCPGSILWRLSLGESLIHMQLFPSDYDFLLMHVVSET